MHAAYEYDALRGLNSVDRAELGRRLSAIETELETGLTGGHKSRELFVTLTACASLILVPWIVVLPVLLPAERAVSHWREIWVGFDVVLALLLASTAWFAFRRRQAVVLVAFVTATVLVCDAWFDVMTAAEGWDRLLSWGSTVFELGLAAVLFNTARLFLHYTAHSSASPDAGGLGQLVGGGRDSLKGLPSELEHLSLRRVIRERRSAR
ncbi:MAG: hypothetical protein DLM58_18230 [Pseudonocardiales bacterium]|nr:MAG: hypothetical protein DLM58_18230 [Pseudonocardiales bacterium]